MQAIDIEIKLDRKLDDAMIGILAGAPLEAESPVVEDEAREEAA